MKKIVKERPINKPFRYFNHTLVTRDYEFEACDDKCFFREKCNREDGYHRNDEITHSCNYNRKDGENVYYEEIHSDKRKEM